MGSFSATKICCRKGFSHGGPVSELLNQAFHPKTLRSTYTAKDCCFRASSQSTSCSETRHFTSTYDVVSQRQRLVCTI